MLRVSKNKGQSALEYGLLIAVLMLALVAINSYMQKAEQGRLKESADNIGKQFSADKYTYSWSTAGGTKVAPGAGEAANYTKTIEERLINDTDAKAYDANANLGTVKNTIDDAEIVTKSEVDSWGDVPTVKYYK